MAILKFHSYILVVYEYYDCTAFTALFPVLNLLTFYFGKIK